MERKFCTQCGSQLVSVQARTYDPYTGEHEQVSECRNPKCHVGCGNLTGHRYGFWSARCKLCGAGIPSLF